MGLTIHWNQRDKKQTISQKKAKECIDFIKLIAEKDGWDILGQWDKEITDVNKKFKDPNNSIVQKERISLPDKVWQVGISVHPHKDCEDVSISFTNGKLIYLEDFGRPNQVGWIKNSQFCKTHYAGFKIHRKVCRLLQAIDKHYMPLEVHDEGGYYGIWDDKKGAENFGEYVAHVKNMVGTLTNQLGVDPKNVISSADMTDGWKEDYIDHLVRENKKKGDKDA